MNARCDGGFGGQECRRSVRLKAHLNGRVKVPDLADTVGPVTESNCAGAISPGGKQLEVNDQSVTQSRVPGQSELDTVGGFWRACGAAAKPEQNSAAGAEGVDRVWQRTADGWRWNDRKFE